jgi:hypothetical protein
MNLKLYNKYVVTLVFSLGFVLMGYAEKTLPKPEARAATPGVPPPGAQVPIDDYIPYLFIVAFSTGIYFYSKPDKKQAID